MAVRRLLHASGLRYRVDYRLPFDQRRRADIAFPRAKVAVFIDGCFWHGCPQHYRPPVNDNGGFWAQKRAENTARDRDTDARLRSDGWEVLRFWEHEAPKVVAQRVADLVHARRSRPQPSVRERT